MAFEWIQKHIAGFGGDSENVTIAGESAGASE
jgi:carboxylesterase type B